jgi:hypothetical protein
MSTRLLSAFEKKLVCIGFLIICTGIICNEWVLTELLSPDDVVEIQNRIAVWLFDILLICLGLFLMMMGKFVSSRDVFRRLSQTYPRTLAGSIGLVLTVLMIACTEGIFYGLHHYGQKDMISESSWIRMPPADREGGFSAPTPRRVHGSVIADPVLGYTLPQNAQIADKMEFQGKRIYEGTYTTDAYSRRVTPIDQGEQRRNFILFFGCSMTFGLWVNDDETMPFYVAQHALHYRPYNYGVSGYGPNHMLAQLQRGDLPQEIHENHGIALYTFIDDHINRAIGRMLVYNQGTGSSPFYMLDVHDRLVSKGNFTSGRPLVSFLYWTLGKSQIFTHFNTISFPARIREEHIRLTARIIEEARNAFQKQFPSGKFYVLLYPGVKRGKDIIPYFERAGVKYFDYASFIAWPQPGLTLEEPSQHPTAQGHKTVAAQLAKDLGISEGDGEW